MRSADDSSPAPRLRLRLREHGGLAVGTLLVGALLLAAALSLLWTPYAVEGTDMAQRLLLPNAHHWLGTDANGRDVLSLLLIGAQASILVGIIAVGIGLVLGTALGLLAAARGGWVQELIMRSADFGFAFPAILSAILLTAAFGAGIVNAIIAIGIYNIPSFIRISRAAAAALWTRDYILAARVSGKNSWEITWEHILPNISAVLTVQATICFALAILAEAALSYLGLGTQAPQPSWGRMLADAQTLVFEAPLLAIWPGLAIALSVLGLNLLGDGLRDLLDPRTAQEA